MACFLPEWQFQHPLFAHMRFPTDNQLILLVDCLHLQHNHRQWWFRPWAKLNYKFANDWRPHCTAISIVCFYVLGWFFFSPNARGKNDATYGLFEVTVVGLMPEIQGIPNEKGEKLEYFLECPNFWHSLKPVTHQFIQITLCYFPLNFSHVFKFPLLFEYQLHALF